ncbi:MAG TPA: ATP-binding protein [Armatimonadota bacterium]|nr:ATP-binding protein [Armatimonadota bacterium]
MPDGPESTRGSSPREHIDVGLRAVLTAVDELAACPDLDTLYRRGIELARERLGVERCSLFVCDGPCIRGTFGTDLHGQTTDERAYARNTTEYPDGRVVPSGPDADRWIYWPSEVSEWEDGHFRAVRRGWVVCTPLWQGSELAGVFYNDTAITGAEVDSELQDRLAVYVSFLSSLIAQRQSERTQEELFRAALISVRELAECPNLDMLCRRAVELARERLGVERCALYLVDGDVLRGTYGTDSEGRTTDEHALSRPLEEGSKAALSQAARSELPWTIEQGVRLTALQGDDVVVVGHGWVAETVLAAHGEPIALFWNDAALSGAPPNQTRQWILSLYCSVLAALIQRRRAEDTRWRMADGLERVIGAAAELMECPDPDTLYRRGVELARERLGIERCGLFLWDGERLHGTYGTDSSGRTTDERALVLERTGAWGRALHLRAPGERPYDLEEVPLSHYDGKTQVMGPRGWVAMTTLATADRVIGGLANDAAISGSPPDEVQQQVLSVYCSILASLIELKRAEAERRDSQLRFQALIENSNDVIMILSAENTITYIAPTCRRILRWDPSEVVGRHAREFIHPDDWPRVATALRRRLTAPGPGEYHEFRIRCGDGTWLDAEGLGYQPGPGSPVDGTIVTVRDVAERKRLESHLRQTSKLEAVGTLVGGVAHDFNNLLTGILGFSDLLLMNVTDTRHASQLRLIRDLAERGAGLVRQLLLFSRAQTGEQGPVDLNRVIEDLTRLLGRVIGEDIHADLALAPDLVTVYADAAQMEQVLMNLAVNARDAMPNGGTLTIRTHNVKLHREPPGALIRVSPGTYACVSVSDTGQGMDEATRERIFEPFFTTKEVGKGTGLGLATVYGIVRQHQGTIEVDSRPGIGTTFRVYLPMGTGPASVTAERAATAAAPEGSETVLVVEDEPSVLDLVCQVLEQQGYQVLPAATPSEAMSLFKAHGGHVDLLITDVVMPQMTGAALHQILVQEAPALRVLYMSGYPSHGGAGAAADLHGQPFLAKPFGPAILVARVREVLDGSGPSAQHGPCPYV